jgi:prolyl-tRNA synthetase
MARRDKGHKEKTAMPREQFISQIGSLLDDIQNQLLGRARAYRQAHTHDLDDKAAFNAFFTPRNSEKPEIHGGFARSHWCGSAECEAKIKEELTVTIRCLPFDGPSEKGRCICCGAPSGRRAVFAKAY